MAILFRASDVIGYIQATDGAALFYIKAPGEPEIPPTVVPAGCDYQWDAYDEGYTAFGDQSLYQTPSRADLKSTNDSIVMWTETDQSGSNLGYVYGIRMNQCASIIDAQLVYDGNDGSERWEYGNLAETVYMSHSNKVAFVSNPGQNRLQVIIADDTTLARVYGPNFVDPITGWDYCTYMVAHTRDGNGVTVWWAPTFYTKNGLVNNLDSTGTTLTPPSVWYTSVANSEIKYLMSATTTNSYVCLLYLHETNNTNAVLRVSITTGAGAIVNPGQDVSANNGVLGTDPIPKAVGAMGDNGFLLVYAESNSIKIRTVDFFGGLQIDPVEIRSGDGAAYAWWDVTETYDGNYLIVGSNSSNNTAYYWIVDENLGIVQEQTSMMTAGASVQLRDIRVMQNGDGLSYSVNVRHYHTSNNVYRLNRVMVLNHEALPPEPPENWVSYFDNTKWVAGFKGVWNGAESRWESVDRQLYIDPIGTWYLGYRPSKIRVTFVVLTGVPPEGMNIDLTDGIVGSLTDPTSAYPTRNSLEEILLVNQQGDFTGLDMVANPTHDFYVTNIEFLE